MYFIRKNNGYSDMHSVIVSIISALGQTSRILNDILDLNKIENSKFILNKEYYYINDILKEVILSYFNSIKEKGLQLNIIINKEFLKVKLYCDKNRIIQCFSNYLSNAIKFTDKGSITIKVEKIENNTMLQFSVIDSGIGIKKENLSLLFQKYRQIQSEHKKEVGTGLGLTIVKNLVNEHNGNVNVISEPGLGSTFSFSIPFKYEIAEPKQHDSFHIIKSQYEKISIPEYLMKNPVKYKEPKLEEIAINDLKVLIVDDSVDNNKFLATILEMNGFTPSTAYNGKEAVDKVKTEHFNVILMDNKMPFMNGVDATKQIKKINPKIIIIGITGMTIDEDIKSFLDAGAEEIITKPINYDQLFSIIDRLSKL